MAKQENTTVGSTFVMKEGNVTAASYCECNHISSMEHCAEELGYKCDTHEDIEDESTVHRHFELLNEKNEKVFAITLSYAEPTEASEKEKAKSKKPYSRYKVEIEGDEHDIEKGLESLKAIIKHLLNPNLEPQAHH